MSVQYSGRISSAQWRLHSGGKNQQRGGYSVLWGDIISRVEDVQYCGGISSVEWRIFSTVEGHHQYSADSTEHPPLYWWYRSTVLNILHSTDDIAPLYWTSSTLLMISLHCTEYPPLYWWYRFTVLNILHSADDIAPLYWTSSTLLMISLHGTEYPPLHNTLHCIAQALPRVTTCEKLIKAEKVSNLRPQWPTSIYQRIINNISFNLSKKLVRNRNYTLVCRFPFIPPLSFTGRTSFSSLLLTEFKSSLFLYMEFGRECEPPSEHEARSTMFSSYETEFEDRELCVS